MILKTFNLRSVADRMQKSGTDPGATTTCPRSVAGRDQLITHTYAQHRRVRDYMHTQRTTHTHTRRAPPGRNPFRGCFYRATAHMRIRTHMTAHAYTRVGTVRASRATTGAVTPPFL